jgi:transcriptional regulator with XRE-family HTH domain
MDDDENAIARRILGVAHAFGSLIRSRRKAMRMRQGQLALATGVGRRFVIDLEAGKPSCQLGRSLLVAEAVGVDLANILAPDAGSQSATASELPDIAEELDELDGYFTRIL